MEPSVSQSLDHVTRLSGAIGATLEALIAAFCRLDKSLSCCWEKGWLVGAVGIELSGPLQTRKLFILRSDKTHKNDRNAEVRYTTGTRRRCMVCAAQSAARELIAGLDLDQRPSAYERRSQKLYLVCLASLPKVAAPLSCFYLYPILYPKDDCPAGNRLVFGPLTSSE